MIADSHDYGKPIHNADGSISIPCTEYVAKHGLDTDYPSTELATTQWVQEYVAKHLPKQPAPTTRSWSLADLAITVLSGVLGGLIAALLGAAVLLILP